MKRKFMSLHTQVPAHSNTTLFGSIAEGFQLLDVFPRFRTYEICSTFPMVYGSWLIGREMGDSLALALALSLSRSLPLSL